MLDQLKELICNYVDVDPAQITEDARFIEDLGFNSYDFMSLLGELEQEFDITVDEQQVVDLHTVGEAVKYMESLIEFLLGWLVQHILYTDKKIPNRT